MTKLISKHRFIKFARRGIQVDQYVNFLGKTYNLDNDLETEALQQKLGVKPDKIFGPKSLAALQAKLTAEPEIDKKPIAATTPKLVSKSGTGNNDDIAYVDLKGYKAFGVLPTGHAGVLVRNANGDAYYYDYGAKANKKAKLLGKSLGDDNDYRIINLGNFKGKSLDEVGNSLFGYFDNDLIGLYWGKGNANAVTKYFTDLANNVNRASYGALNNNCSTQARNAYHLGLGEEAKSDLVDLPTYNHPNTLETVLNRVVDQSAEDAYLLRLSDYDTSAAAYWEQILNMSPEERRLAALYRSRTNKAPNTVFTYAGNLSTDKRELASRNTMGNISNCINTVTSFYDPYHTVSSNEAFVDNPEYYGFLEIDENERTEGDLAILFEGNHPYHGTMINGFDTNGLPLLNYSNGSTKYKTNRPISAFSGPGNSHKHTGTKYYRYVGGLSGDTKKLVAYYWRRLLNMFG